MLLIEYNFKNILNKLVVLNQYYNQRNTWLNYNVPTKNLPNAFLTHYREKEFNNKYSSNKFEQPCYTPTKNNIIKYVKDDFSLYENANALTALSGTHWHYNNILQDNEDKKDFDYNGIFLRDFLVRLRKNYNADYKDYTNNVDDYSSVYLVPNSLRNFYSYRTQNNGYICVDKDSHTLFTITLGPINYINPNSKNKKPSERTKEDYIDNPFRWKFKFYKYSEKNVNALILKDLFKILPLQVSQDALLDSILNLWKYQLLQHKSEIKNQDKLIKEIIDNESFNNNKINEKTFIDFLHHIYQILLSNNNIQQKEIKRNLTYQNLCDFYNEVQKGILTKKSHNILNYFNSHTAVTITDDDSKLKDTEKEAIVDNIKMLSYHPRFTTLTTSFKRVDESEPKLANILSQIKEDSHFNSSYTFTNNMFEIIYDKEDRDTVKYPDLFWGIHGTSNYSIPSILLNGLKNSDELVALMKKENELNKHNKDYIKYSISGQALGQGVYFAQLNQPSKSIYFTDSNYNPQSLGYFIVANVCYNKNNVYNAQNFKDYYKQTKKPTLIESKQIGILGLNEYVAPISQNIHIKYLLEVQYKA